MPKWKILNIRKLTSREKQSMGFFQRMHHLYHKNQQLEVINPDRCLGCGLCFKACRHRAIRLEEPTSATPFKQFVEVL